MHSFFLLLLSASPLLAIFDYDICKLASTGNQFFLVGPCGMLEAAPLCIAADARIASIFDRTVSPAALQQYLSIRRGMRACNSTYKAWVRDKSLSSKAAEACDDVTPSLRIQTFTGMVDIAPADTRAQYMVLCQTPSKANDN